MRTSVKALAAAGAMAAGLMTVQPMSATAAVDPAGVCGSGYRKVLRLPGQACINVAGDPL
ncbi:hypothetical protein FHR32_005555 [Streptosporangium album]|uniref:Porin n=1 Tax=Streptosporangium album TaxID=47479 RepID=A0A7W7RZN7_9ACTN|nr:hypothetical protein [Streptosporangium album]